jgi:hypothetical protein
MISMGDRVRSGIDQAKSDPSREDYSVRKMMVEYLRFNAVGVFNVSFFFSLNYFLNWVDLSEYKSLTVWAPSWGIGAIQAHATHRWITFRSSAPYGESLIWASIVYGVTAILSTTSVFLLVDLSGVNYWIAWAMNTVAFGFAGFVGLRCLAFPPSLDVNQRGDGGEATGRRSGCCL